MGRLKTQDCSATCRGHLFTPTHIVPVPQGHATASARPVLLRDLLAFRNIDVRPGFGTGLHTKCYFYLPGDPAKWIGVKFGPDSGVCTSSTKKLFVFHRPGLTTATNNVKQQEVRKTTNGIFSWTIESRACATGAVTRSKTHKRFPKRSGIFARR